MTVCTHQHLITDWLQFNQSIKRSIYTAPLGQFSDKPLSSSTLNWPPLQPYFKQLKSRLLCWQFV